MFRKFAGSLKRSTVVAIASVVVGTLFVGIPVVLPASAAAPVGLVGRWSFESNVADTSGNGQAAGQMFGAATYGAGKTGNGLVLNGSTNTFAQIPNSATLNTPTTALTVSVWVKPGAGQNWNSMVSRQFGTAGDDQFAILAAGGVRQYLNTSGQGNQSAGGGALAASVWSHVATTYDGTMQRLNLNGVEVASAPRTGALVATDRPLIVGGNANDAVANTAQELFTGSIDELCVYSRALSVSELSAGTDCSSQTPVTTTTPTTTPGATPSTTVVSGTTAGLVGLWSFETM
jgi:Concanavalin A-like lectin/glucanases superfamily